MAAEAYDDKGIQSGKSKRAPKTSKTTKPRKGDPDKKKTKNPAPPKPKVSTILTEKEQGIIKELQIFVRRQKADRSIKRDNASFLEEFNESSSLFRPKIRESFQRGRKLLGEDSSSEFFGSADGFGSTESMDDMWVMTALGNNNNNQGRRRDSLSQSCHT